MIFAAAGFKVKIYDIKKDQIEAALDDIASQLKTLEKNGLLRDRDPRVVLSGPPFHVYIMLNN